MIGFQKFARAWLLGLAEIEVGVIQPGDCPLLDKSNRRLILETKPIQAFEALVPLAPGGNPTLLI